MGNTLTRTDALIATINERERLGRVVIEAVRHEKTRKMLPRLVEEAIDALNKFEAEHAGVEGVHE